jgi:SARP family transcriptional regulator, regulator of embCAB operon
MNDEPGTITFRLLGPLSMFLNGVDVTPGATKQRQIMALLALNAGHVVTVPTLTTELWGDSQPRSAATTLQTYILQLRNRMSAAAPQDARARTMISTRLGGYMLDAAACESDVPMFRGLAREGRAHAEAGDFLTASDLLSRALSLWRGSALADMRLGPILELDAAALEEARLGVLERRINVDLALGRHIDLLGELTVLSARNSMNENFCALLMIALYRSGHVGRALAAFQNLRRVLREELGVEPCPRLQRLQQRILSGDPGLESGEPATHGHRPNGRGRVQPSSSGNGIAPL